MCGRARLSSDVSEIKIAFGIPPERLEYATDLVFRSPTILKPLYQQLSRQKRRQSLVVELK